MGGEPGYQGNPGANALARVLSSRMNKQSESPLVLDFGSIEADYSLKTNTFPVPIPKADYAVCRSIGKLSFSTRVLVAWVQNEAVVIDVIVPAGKL